MFSVYGNEVDSIQRLWKCDGLGSASMEICGLGSVSMEMRWIRFSIYGMQWIRFSILGYADWNMD